MSFRLPPVLALAVIALLQARALDAQAATVFVTETGRAYHRDGCPCLQRTRLPIPLPEAVALGYAPYGCLLAYVYLPDGSCHNAERLREGYAHAYIRFPFHFLEEFRALQSAARRQGRGLWASGGQEESYRAPVG